MNPPTIPGIQDQKMYLGSENKNGIKNIIDNPAIIPKFLEDLNCKSISFLIKRIF